MGQRERNMDTTDCTECGAPISDARIRRKAIFCTNECRTRADKQAYAKSTPHNGLTCGTVGALHELLVCTDLLRQGFEVFRAVSPSCSCDVAFLYEGQLYRVEVTTGKIWRTGNKSHPRKDPSKFDVLAVAYISLEHGDTVIEYDPPLNTIQLTEAA